LDKLQEPRLWVSLFMILTLCLFALASSLRAQEKFVQLLHTPFAATPCAFSYSWYFLTLLYLSITFRILCSGHTGHYPKWWSVQLQMMFVFFSASIIRWWKSWTKDRYGILQFVEHCILDVSALMRIIMLIGPISLLFQVLCFINLSILHYFLFPNLPGIVLPTLWTWFVCHVVFNIHPIWIKDKSGAKLSKLDSFALHCIGFNYWVSLLETMGKDFQLRKFVISHKIMSLTI
jgi:hypothetical protein